MANAIEMLRDRVKRDGPSKVAKELGVSRQNIWQILRGTWKPGPKMLAALGLKKVERVIRA